MRSTLLSLTVLAAGAMAVQVPACANRCVAKAMAKTDCAAADTRCLCESEHFLGYLRYCSGKLCSEKHEKRDAVESMTSLCSLLLTPSSTEEEVAPEAQLHVQRRKIKGEESKVSVDDMHHPGGEWDPWDWDPKHHKGGKHHKGEDPWGGDNPWDWDPEKHHHHKRPPKGGPTGYPTPPWYPPQPTGTVVPYGK